MRKWLIIFILIIIPQLVNGLSFPGPVDNFRLVDNSSNIIGYNVRLIWDNDNATPLFGYKVDEKINEGPWSNYLADASYCNISECHYDFIGKIYGYNYTYRIAQISAPMVEGTMSPSLTIFFSEPYYPTPTISYEYDIAFNYEYVNITLYCEDSLYALNNYSIVSNGITLLNVSSAFNSSFSNVSIINNGLNTFKGICCNRIGCQSDIITPTIYQKELALIDEKTRLDFNVSNTSSCKVYIDNQTLMYDLKAAGTNKVNYTGGADDSLRFELVYTDGTIITRYIHPDLLPNGIQIRVCANKDDQFHKEQLIASASRKPSVMISVWADCIVGADYTRFAYETYKVMRDYTIDTQYYLFTWDEDGNQVMLAAIDGGVTSTVNLDVLEFQNEGYNLNILADSLAFDQTGNTTMRIYYQNLDNDNTALSLTITNMDTSAVMLSQAAFPDMNEFTVYFDWSTYTNITNTTLFKVELIRTSETGIETIKKYFNTRGSIGRVGSGLAVGLAFILMIFGLTFAATRITMSWFGIAICLASIVILSQAVAAWYVTFMMMVDVIVLVYFAIMLIVQNYGTTAGIN